MAVPEAAKAHQRLIITIIVSTLCLSVLIVLVNAAVGSGKLSDVGRDAVISIVSALVGVGATYANMHKVS